MYLPAASALIGGGARCPEIPSLRRPALSLSRFALHRELRRALSFSCRLEETAEEKMPAPSHAATGPTPPKPTRRATGDPGGADVCRRPALFLR